MKIGLLGCGTIGATIAQALAKNAPAGLELTWIVDQVKSESVQRAQALHHCGYSQSAADLITARVDWVIEAAGVEAARAHVLSLLESQINVLMMSVGTLVDEEFAQRIFDTARANHCIVRVPSGAIGGLDALRSAQATNSLRTVSVTSTKPPQAWAGAPYLIEHQIDLSKLSRPQILFEGSATRAILGFPKNVNVMAAVCLAGIGFQKTSVRAVADPSITQNIHQVHADGEFGELDLTIRNFPSPENPRTSFLASSSAIAACFGLVSPLQIGVG